MKNPIPKMLFNEIELSLKAFLLQHPELTPTDAVIVLMMIIEQICDAQNIDLEEIVFAFMQKNDPLEPDTGPSDLN